MARANTDLHALNDAFHQHKEKVDDGLSKKLDKSEFGVVIGSIISAFMILVGVVYCLSYSDIRADVKELKGKSDATEKRLDKMDFRIDTLSKSRPH